MQAHDTANERSQTHPYTHTLARMTRHTTTCTYALQGADVNGRGPFDLSPLLMLCAADGHEDMIARLIEAGADVHAQDSIGNTPLHEAVVPSPFLLTIFSNMPPPSL